MSGKKTVGIKTLTKRVAKPVVKRPVEDEEPVVSEPVKQAKPVRLVKAVKTVAPTKPVKKPAKAAKPVEPEESEEIDEDEYDEPVPVLPKAVSKSSSKPVSKSASKPSSKLVPKSAPKHAVGKSAARQPTKLARVTKPVVIDSVAKMHPRSARIPGDVALASLRLAAQNGQEFMNIVDMPSANKLKTALYFTTRYLIQGQPFHGVFNFDLTSPLIIQPKTIRVQTTGYASPQNPSVSMTISLGVDPTLSQFLTALDATWNAEVAKLIRKCKANPEKYKSVGGKIALGDPARVPTHKSGLLGVNKDGRESSLIFANIGFNGFSVNHPNLSLQGRPGFIVYDYSKKLKNGYAVMLDANGAACNAMNISTLIPAGSRIHNLVIDLGSTDVVTKENGVDTWKFRPRIISVVVEQGGAEGFSDMSNDEAFPFSLEDIIGSGDHPLGDSYASESYDPKDVKFTTRRVDSDQNPSGDYEMTSPESESDEGSADGSEEPENTEDDGGDAEEDGDDGEEPGEDEEPDDDDAESGEEVIYDEDYDGEDFENIETE